MRGSKNPVPNLSNSRASRAKRSFKLQEFERPGISLDEIQQIKQAFDLFDPEGTGIVHPKCNYCNKKELKAALTSLGGQAKNQPIFHMINELVEEGTDEIDFNGFLDLMTARISNKDSRQDMRKVFMLFDEEKTGFISLASLKKVVKQLGENIDEAQLQEMIQKADQDRDGLINEEQFYNVMTRKVGK